MKRKALKGILYLAVLVLFLAGGVLVLLTCDNKEEPDNGNEIEIPLSDGDSMVSLVQTTTVAQATQFTYEEILAMTCEAINLAGGLEDIVKSGDVVVLKPNVVSAFYNWGIGPDNSLPMNVNGIATDWRVIQAVAEIVREIVGSTGKIMLIEGSAGGSSSVAHFNAVGWTAANLTAVDEIIGLESEGTWQGPGVGTSADTQITLPDFDYNKADSGKLSWGDYKYNDYYKNDGKYWVNTKMLDADVLISIPVLKTHNAAGGVTGAIKNIGIGAAPPNVYGLNSNSIGRNAMINHGAMVIHDWISDYYRCLPADFVVMDGLQGLENGPGGQSGLAALQADQKNLRCILASKDALALDIVEANIMNWDMPKYMKNIAVRGQVFARGEIGKSNPRMIPMRGNPKNIVVVGNKKVDDVRGNAFTSTVNQTASWSGSLNNGGRKLTEADLTKPTVTINSAVFYESNLDLNLTLSTGANNTVIKIDVYIDEIYKESFHTNMIDVSLDASDIASGSHNIKVYAYTKYMSHAVADTTVTK